MPSYISEYSYFGFADTEFVEVAVPEGTDVSGYSIVLYQGNGTIVESWDLGSVQSTTAGHDVYVVDSNTAGFNATNGSGEIWADDAIAFVDNNGNVIQFLSHEGFEITAVQGPASGMTSTNAGTVNSMGDSLTTDDQGSTYESRSPTTKGTIACFAPGVMIDTDKGPCLVEDLRCGDVVITLNGPKPVVWVWSGDQPLEDARDDQKPVLIKAGALGCGRPTRDLVVSCQHRMLLGGRGALSASFDEETLAPAKALTNLAGVRFMKGKRKMMWHHFALERHGVVRANGAWSESLLLGQMVLSRLPFEDRSEVFTRFTPSRGSRVWNGPPARTCLTPRETREKVQAALQLGPA